jgi:diacylglycerol kinase family enzyme
MVARVQTARSLRVRPRFEPGRRIAVVLNANARQVSRKVVTSARDVVPSGDLFVSRTLEEATQIAQTIVDRGYDAVFAGGGDGTFTRCISDLHHYAEKSGRLAPAMGVLRLGTGNALAEAMGIPKDSSLDDLLGFARIAPERMLDVLSVDGQLAPFAGIGLDAQILDDFNAVGRGLDDMGLGFIRSGGVRYALSVGLRSVPRFVFTKNVSVTIVNAGSPAWRIGANDEPEGDPIPSGEVLYSGPVSIAACSTIPYVGLGMRLFPFAGSMPRRFQLRISDCPAHEILRHLPALFRGTFRSPRVHDFMADRVTMYLDREAPLQVGGDVGGKHRTVQLALAPRPIRIVC